MKITVNGDAIIVPNDVKVVQDLLGHFELTDRIVMVELNKTVIDHTDHRTHEIKDGDQFQLVQFVGGG
ncbi:sulfur carrier protein ThiS [Jeotgalibacillus sp. S-D1]|uniref:sulfur carrier protein ThiS n=1 Tax=Jeotgalibacillus sp. S-D1 TaxID=2552189 RepID=UPI0010599C1C|nr:sulfur carrier protein ThiS [Jeotgalibacillus sp. S-D1]TDL30881.1 sulfur carrier protein ThiS [Jeotgalibacillus sp. S-D1]